MSRRSTLTVVLTAALSVAAVTEATPINYGNLNGGTVVYQQITEESSTHPGAPLYGAPSVAGDSLNFSPTGFGINTSNGSFAYMDGTLSTSLVAIGVNRIEKIRFSERGDYTLAGAGTSATSASVANTLFIRITNIDGGAIAPITGSFSMTFTPNNGAYNLAAHPGVLKAWEGVIEVDIDAMIVAANPAYAGRKATKVDISLDNALLAFSEPGTIAYIKKKQAEGVTITAIVPEPATVVMLIGGAMLLWRRR